MQKMKGSNIRNAVNTEAAPDAIMIICDVKYDKIRKYDSENFKIL